MGTTTDRTPAANYCTTHATDDIHMDSHCEWTQRFNIDRLVRGYKVTPNYWNGYDYRGRSGNVARISREDTLVSFYCLDEFGVLLWRSDLDWHAPRHMAAAMWQALTALVDAS